MSIAYFSTIIDAGVDEVGSVRRLTMEPDGRVVRERLVHYDAEYVAGVAT